MPGYDNATYVFNLRYLGTTKSDTYATVALLGRQRVIGIALSPSAHQSHTKSNTARTPNRTPIAQQQKTTTTALRHEHRRCP